MVEAILGMIGTLLYPLFSVIFLVINLLQNVFYSFAGLGTVYYGDTNGGGGGTSGGAGFTEITGDNDGGETSTGLIYYLLNSSIVKNILISITILALFLLVIFTTLAFIKTIYAEKPKSWKGILANAIKGLTNFIVLPVCCLLGVWVGNIILQAVNGATSPDGSLYLDRKLFVSCAYSANTYRVNTFTADDANLFGVKKCDEAYDDIMATIEAYGGAKEFGNIKVEKGKDSSYYADVVDKLYGYDVIPIHNYITVGIGITSHHGYYQLWNINYLFLVVGGVFMLTVLINLTYGMIKRMFILLMLFVISPAVCAMYPLDEGSAVKSWSGDVKKNILSAYAAVAGMNLFFSFMPIIEKINLSAFGIVGAYAADWLFVSDILQLIILICGLFCVQDFTSTIAGYFTGGANAANDGKSLRGDAKGAIQKQTKAVGSFVGTMNNARKVAQVGGFGAGLGSLVNSAWGSSQKQLGLDWGLKESGEKAVEDYRKKYNDNLDKDKAKRDTTFTTTMGDYADTRVESAVNAENARRKKAGLEELGGSELTGFKIRVLDKAGDRYEKIKDEDGKISADDFVKGRVHSKKDAATTLQEAVQLGGLDAKAQQLMAEKIALEYNTHRGAGEKVMNAEDVIKEMSKLATSQAATEARASAYTGLTQKSKEYETKTSELTAEDTVKALRVKELGVDVVKAKAQETNAGGLTDEALKYQDLLASYNKVQDKDLVKTELSDAVKMYEDTMRGVAETLNKSLKAAFNQTADLIKNALNQGIDPKKISDAIQEGVSSGGKDDKKQMQEIAKLLQKLISDK